MHMLADALAYVDGNASNGLEDGRHKSNRCGSGPSARRPKLLFLCAFFSFFLHSTNTRMASRTPVHLLSLPFPTHTSSFPFFFLSFPLRAGCLRILITCIGLNRISLSRSLSSRPRWLLALNRHQRKYKTHWAQCSSASHSRHSLRRSSSLLP